MSDFAIHATGLEGLIAVSAKSAHSFPKHSHDEFGIGLLVAGGQLSASGRGQVEASTGDIITVNPGEVHDGMPISGRPRRWHMLYLAPSLLTSLAAGISQARCDALEFEAPVLSSRLRSRQFEQAWTAALGSARDAGLLQEETLLSLMAGMLQPAIPERRPAIGSGIERAKASIDDNVSDNPSLAELAKTADLSRFQTLRAFTRATGLTPHAYILQQRVLKARRMIASGNTLATVAADCGFADQSHMTREFSRRYGMPPARFQRAMLGCNPVQDRTPKHG